MMASKKLQEDTKLATCSSLEMCKKAIQKYLYAKDCTCTEQKDSTYKISVSWDDGVLKDSKLYVLATGRKNIRYYLMHPA